MIASAVAPAHVAANAYWKQVKPLVDWQFMLVIGIPLGAWLAARLSRGTVSFTTALPEAWVNRLVSVFATVHRSGRSGRGDRRLRD